MDHHCVFPYGYLVVLAHFVEKKNVLSPLNCFVSFFLKLSNYSVSVISTLFR